MPRWPARAAHAEARVALERPTKAVLGKAAFSSFALNKSDTPNEGGERTGESFGT